MNNLTGKYIILAGLLVVVVGLIVYFFHDRLTWLGRLPGDIRVEKEKYSFYFPITTMVVLSAVVSLALYIIRRFF